jgi:hypothetical protein
MIYFTATLLTDWKKGAAIERKLKAQHPLRKASRARRGSHNSHVKAASTLFKRYELCYTSYETESYLLVPKKTGFLA